MIGPSTRDRLPTDCATPMISPCSLRPGAARDQAVQIGAASRPCRAPTGLSASTTAGTSRANGRTRARARSAPGRQASTAPRRNAGSADRSGRPASPPTAPDIEEDKADRARPRTEPAIAHQAKVVSIPAKARITRKKSTSRRRQHRPSASASRSAAMRPRGGRRALPTGSPAAGIRHRAGQRRKARRRSGRGLEIGRLQVIARDQPAEHRPDDEAEAEGGADHAHAAARVSRRRSRLRCRPAPPRCCRRKPRRRRGPANTIHSCRSQAQPQDRRARQPPCSPSAPAGGRPGRRAGPTAARRASTSSE